MDSSGISFLHLIHVGIGDPFRVYCRKGAVRPCVIMIYFLQHPLVPRAPGGDYYFTSQWFPQFLHRQTDLYVTTFFVLATLVDFPVYFFLRKHFISSMGMNATIHSIISTIHHHQPMHSHQRIPCPFCLYFDLVFVTVVDP